MVTFAASAGQPLAGTGRHFDDDLLLILKFTFVGLLFSQLACILAAVCCLELCHFFFLTLESSPWLVQWLLFLSVVLVDSHDVND